MLLSGVVDTVLICRLRLRLPFILLMADLLSALAAKLLPPNPDLQTAQIVCILVNSLKEIPTLGNPLLTREIVYIPFK